MASLERLLAERPGVIYPAHGPRIADGVGKLREYIAHRLERERQILAALADGCEQVAEIVRRVYSAYPEALHAAAASSVSAHLRKLEAEGRVRCHGSADPLAARWTRA
jgi:glyoxylase-like metal-dependent hydrolase (beta-lactamase superfamily II)